MMAGRTPNIDELVARVGDFKYTFLEQPDGWFDPKVHLDWPGIRNLRLDPFEKMTIGESLFAANWWAYEFWRFVIVQQEVAKLGESAIEFPPMQQAASFNLSAVKEKIEKAMANRAGPVAAGLDRPENFPRAAGSSGACCMLEGASTPVV